VGAVWPGVNAHAGTVVPAATAGRESLRPAQQQRRKEKWPLSKIPVKVEARQMPKKKTRVVLRKKVDGGRPMTPVDRLSTHRLTNPRAVERYLDAMTLHHALILADK